MIAEDACAVDLDLDLLGRTKSTEIMAAKAPSRRKARRTDGGKKRRRRNEGGRCRNVYDAVTMDGLIIIQKQNQKSSKFECIVSKMRSNSQY